MRTLAIGDIHGSNNALTALCDYVNFHSDDIIVTLGDYIDRGPDYVPWLLMHQYSHSLWCKPRG
jgi:predicted phosphodiesterase